MQQCSLNASSAHHEATAIRLKAIVCNILWVVYLLWVRFTLDYLLQDNAPLNCSFQSTSIMVTILLTLLPCFVTIKVLHSSCDYYFHKWSEGLINRDLFVTSEYAMRQIRWMCYAVALANLYFANSSCRFRDNEVLSLAAVLMVIPFFICNLQSLYRLTFRNWPNHAIAFGNSILYLAMLAMPYKDLNLWGLASISPESIAAVIDSFPDSLKSSIIIATIVAVLNESLKDTLSGVINQEPSNVSQRRRRIRRKLLTHWYYKKDGTLSTNENLVVNLAVLFTLVYLLCLLCSFKMNSCGFPHFLASSTIAEETTEEYSTPLLPNNLNSDQSDEEEKTEDSSNTEVLTISSYMVILAMVLFISGVMAHWNISNDRLIQSEYLYLVFQGARLTTEDVEKSTSHWKDYCQVLVYLYSNVSGIASEDRGYHNLSNMLNILRQYLGRENDCVKTKMLCDILCAKGDINAKLLREYPHNEKAEAKNKDAQQAQDLQFSTNLLNLLDECRGNKGKNLIEYNPLELIELAGTCFFENRESTWGARFSVYNMSAQEGIQLLKMDAMIHILQRETMGDCGLSWLGCNCKQHSQNCEGVSEDALIRKRLELLLSYPFIIIQCFAKRWEYQFDNYLFGGDVFCYYENIYEQEIYAQNAEQISYIVDNVLRYLAELDLGSAIVIDSAEQFSVYRLKMTESDEDPSNSELTKIKQRMGAIGRVKNSIISSRNTAAIRKRIVKFSFNQKKENDGDSVEQDGEDPQDVYSNLLEIACCLFATPQEEMENGA